MKKILLSAITCLTVATLSFGQNFTALYGDTVTAVITGSIVDVKNYIINNTSSPATYDWKITGSDLPSGWGYDGLCDNKQCTTGLTGGSLWTSSPVNGGDSMFYHATFKDEGVANGSSAWVTSTIYETGSPSGARKLTFIATKSTTSAISVIRSEDNIVVFPNPAKSSVNVIYGADMDVKNIGIYNLIGKMVSVYKVGNTSAKLDVENLPSGIYFIRLFDNQGKVVGTRKFTRQ